jgi:hypothetical protein
MLDAFLARWRGQAKPGRANKSRSEYALVEVPRR